MTSDMSDAPAEPTAETTTEAPRRPRDWDDWRDCLAWLAELFTAPEMAELFGWPTRSVQHWFAGRQAPDPARRREVMALARLIRGRLAGLEERGTLWEGSVPTTLPAAEEVPPGLDPQGLPTEGRLNSIMGRWTT